MITDTIITNYSDHHAELSEVRQGVFVEEQRVPKDIEWDDRDAHCVHVLIRVDGRAAATGRIDLEKDGKIGRVAVVASARRLGLGRLVMEALEREAELTGLKRVWFHAQASAIEFYQKLGYKIVSDEFMEAGIPHRKMEKILGS